MVKSGQILNGLKLTKEQIGDFLFTTNCERMLSPQTRKAWEHLKTKSKDLSHPLGYSCSFDDLLKILKEHMKYHQKISREVQKKPTGGGEGPKKDKSPPKGGVTKGQPSLPSSYGTKEHHKKCGFCNKDNHFTTQCKSLKPLKKPERLKKIKEEHRCFLCFDNHRVTKCPFKDKWNCTICKKQHNAQTEVSLIGF